MVAYRDRGQNEFFKLREAASKMGISYRTILRWVESGKLKTIPPANYHRVERAEIGRLMTEKVRPKR